MRSPDDAWAPGTYTLVFSIDGVAGQCTMQVPASPLPDGAPGLCAITDEVMLSLSPMESCPSIACNAGACGGMGCTPMPGRFQMILNIAPRSGADGAPVVVRQVALDLSVDGKTLLNTAIAPTATTADPDGPGCGTCTNASATLTVS